MSLIRAILRFFILTFDRLFVPKALVRRPEDQMRVDSQTSKLALYQFEACPFCVKTRREVKRLGLKIELKDAKRPEAAEELIQGGGSLQVPCLRIQEDDGTVRWMYESSDINEYLRKRFAPTLTA